LIQAPLRVNRNQRI